VGVLLRARYHVRRHTAGVAALLLQRNPLLTPAAVQTALRAGAAEIGAVGFDDASGFGRLDALASAQAAVRAACGVGGELVLVLPLLAALRRRRQEIRDR